MKSSTVKIAVVILALSSPKVGLADGWNIFGKESFGGFNLPDASSIHAYAFESYIKSHKRSVNELRRRESLNRLATQEESRREANRPKPKSDMFIELED